MRIATWNVNSLKARLERVIAWVSDAAPDILCIQETKLADKAFPTAAFAEIGYDSVHFGQGQWNGVAIVSKVGITEVKTGLLGSVDEEARAISATCGGIRVSSLYVPNGRALDADHYLYKLSWMADLARAAAVDLANFDRVVLAGDFNIALSDIDVWDPKSLVGMTHVSQPERDSLQKVLDVGLFDLFRMEYEGNALFSWWDYRGGSFHKRQGMRIDLILGNQGVANELTWVLIDRNQRKGAGPSDHAPVICEF